MSAHPILRVALVLLALTMSCPLVRAQNRPGFPPNRPGQPGQPFQPGRPGQPSSGGDAAGCAACGISAVFMIVVFGISIAAMIAWIFVAIWVSKDAKARGMDNSGMWVVLVLFTSWIGLIIYIVTRPQGELKVCRECGNKRLRESYRCPHCRAA